MYSIIIIGNNSFINKKRISPLSLLKINDNSIITSQVEAIRRLKKYEIIFVGDSLSFDLSKKWYKNYRYINANTINTGHSLRIGLGAAKYNKIAILHDNILIKPSFFSFLNKNRNYIFAQKDQKSTKNNVGCCIYNGIVQQLFFDLPNKWSQAIYLNDNCSQKIRELKDYDHKFDFEIYNKLIEEFTFHVSFKEVTVISSEKELKAARKNINESHISNTKKSYRNRNKKRS